MAHALRQKRGQPGAGVRGRNRQLQILVLAVEHREIGAQAMIEPLALESPLVGGQLLRTEARHLRGRERTRIETAGLVSGGILHVGHDIRRQLIGHRHFGVEPRDCDVPGRIGGRESRQIIAVVRRKQGEQRRRDRGHDADEIGLEAIELIALGLVRVASAELETPAARDPIVGVHKRGFIL